MTLRPGGGGSALHLNWRRLTKRSVGFISDFLFSLDHNVLYVIQILSKFVSSACWHGLTDCEKPRLQYLTFLSFFFLHFHSSFFNEHNFERENRKIPSSTGKHIKGLILIRNTRN